MSRIVTVLPLMCFLVLGSSNLDAEDKTFESPNRPTSLMIENFQPASHVGPDDSTRWPQPVTVVLHGNYDRPEWQCETWKAVAGFRGWILCPRGVPTPWAEKAADRWTYQGRKRTLKEIEAGLLALEKRYPGKVTRKELALAGFSLGAILAPGIIADRPSMFSYLFLIEGAVDRLGIAEVRKMKRSGILGIGLAMSSPGYRRQAKKLVPKIERHEIRAVFVDMAGTGHNYSDDFDTTGQKAIRTLVR